MFHEEDFTKNRISIKTFKKGLIHIEDDYPREHGHLIKEIEYLIKQEEKTDKLKD